MTLRRRITPAAIGLLLLTVPSFAQTPGQRMIMEQTGALRQEGWVRVQSTINFFVAGPTGESEEAQKLRDRARRAVYEMAARECDLLRDVIAKDCRMESVLEQHQPAAWQPAAGRLHHHWFDEFPDHAQIV